MATPKTSAGGLERRLLMRSAICGLALSLAVLSMQLGGGLRGLEGWMYDRRAAACQVFNTAPSNQLVHLDIDDRALEAIGHWPWPRSRMAEILEEVGRASPKAVAIDVIYSEPEDPLYVPPATQAATTQLIITGDFKRLDGDGDLAAALHHLGNTVLPFSLLVPSEVPPLRRALFDVLRANPELTDVELMRQLESKGIGALALRLEFAKIFLPARR